MQGREFQAEGPAYVRLGKEFRMQVRLRYRENTYPIPTPLLVGCAHWGSIKFLAVEVAGRVFPDSEFGASLP